MNKSLGPHFCPLWCPQALARACPELGKRVSESLAAAESQCLLKRRGGEQSMAPMCRVPAGGGAGLWSPAHTTQGSHELGSR